MVEKFCRKDAKKGNFSKQMEFRKMSNNLFNLSFGFFYLILRAFYGLDFAFLLGNSISNMAFAENQNLTS